MRSTCILLLLYVTLVANAQITPEISSWILNTTGATGYNNIPSNVQKVQYSDSNVYVSASCIPGYDIGPWQGNPNTPKNQNFVFKITRFPKMNPATPINTGLGHIGVWTNGVSIYNPKDGMSYNNQNVWNQNAIVVEGPSFDNCLGHPAPNGEYHHHLNPHCLYNDSLTSEHAPIIGYAFDGFPVYGAFGYANQNGTGGIKRMQSSYHLRNITKRTTLPNGLPAASAGPDVSTRFPLGYYVEDFEYLAGSGDLDEHNGRFCITPEYPNGIYAYFVTLDSNLKAAYPYVLGISYYGLVPAGNTGPGSGHNTIRETVITYNGTTEIKETKLNLDASIFGNPAKSIISIFINENAPNNLKAALIDLNGQPIQQWKYLQPGFHYTFDISEFENGLYFIKIFNDKFQQTKKVQIAH